MTNKIVRDAVRQDDEGWGFSCPLSGCGDPDTDVGYTSTGWPTKAIALDRLEGHIAEHAEGDAARAEGREVDRSKLAPDLDTFRAKHGLVESADRRRALRAEDLL